MIRRGWTCAGKQMAPSYSTLVISYTEEFVATEPFPLAKSKPYARDTSHVYYDNHELMITLRLCYCSSAITGGLHIPTLVLSAMQFAGRFNILGASLCSYSLPLSLGLC